MKFDTDKVCGVCGNAMPDVRFKKDYQCDSCGIEICDTCSVSLCEEHDQIEREEG